MTRKAPGPNIDTQMATFDDGEFRGLIGPRGNIVLGDVVRAKSDPLTGGIEFLASGINARATFDVPNKLSGNVSIWSADVEVGDINTARRMMIPSPYDLGDAAADRDGWALAQTTAGAGSLVLTGAQPTIPLEVSLYSTGNLSGVTFTITGVDILGRAKTEAITGPNNTTRYGSVAWASISQVTVNGAVGTDVEVGWRDSLESDAVVHPSMVYVPDGWNGYKYWLAYTPYRSAQISLENPCIAASNNCTVWDAPAQNPLVQPPSGTAYLSDVHLYLLPDRSKMMMMYRGSGLVPGKDQLIVIESADGRTWSEPVVVWSFVNSAGNPRLVSPSFFYDGTQWVIYAHDVNSAGNPLVRMARAGDIDSIYTDWSALTPSAVTMPNVRGWWHSHLLRLDSGRIIGTASDNGSGGGQAWLLQSDDGLIFSTKQTAFAGNLFYRNCVHVEADRMGVAEKLVVIAGIQDSRSSPNFRFQRVIYQLTGKLSGRNAAVLSALRQYGINADDRGNLLLAVDGFTGTVDTNIDTTANGLTWTHGDTNNILYNGSGGAKNENTSNCRAWVNVGTPDYSAQVAIVNRSTTGQAWLLFRLSAADNYFRFGCNNAGEYRLDCIINGVYGTGPGSILIPNITAAHGDVIRAETDGRHITCFVNGLAVYAMESAFHLGNTKTGLQLMHSTIAGGVVVDNFVVHRLS